MKTGQATGLQIAFLMYAVMLLAVPASAFVVKAGRLEGVGKLLVESGLQFALGVLILLAFPRTRAFVLRSLSMPIPSAMRAEVVLVTLTKPLLAFASVGGLALWVWYSRGQDSLVGLTANPERDYLHAFSAMGLAKLLLAVGLGPIVEEVVFRGFIYRAFERQWGWFASLLATSALFGLYHTYFWSAFAASVVYVCLLRRTGSLWAPIIAHSFFNLMLWWPLLGQFVFPHGAGLSEPSTWHLHFACLAVAVVALPVYIWISRDRNESAPTVLLEPNGALSK